jgi:iron complex outermembrane receptor protein
VRQRQLLVFVSLMTAGWVWSGSSFADPPLSPSEQPTAALEEIVVTAQKRTENIQNVPISVAVATATTLENSHITNLGDLPLLVPALTIAQNNDAFNIFIRGVGNPATVINDESSIAVYIDGVYYPRLPPALFELNNIDNIETLKGPQGTLFGRNATGGLIQITTKDPSQTPTLHIDGGYGNFQTFTGNLYASTGFGDQIAGDIALHDTHMGAGWGHNLYDGTSLNFLEEKAARTKWVYRPAEGTKLTLAIDYSDSQSTQGMLAGLQGGGFTHGPSCGATCTPFTPPPAVPYPYYGFYNANYDGEDIGKDISAGVSLKLEQEFSFAKLVSISAARHSFGTYDADADYSPQPYYQEDVPYRQQSVSQELQLLSEAGTVFDWTAGLFFMNLQSEYNPIRATGAKYADAFDLPEGAFDIWGGQRVKSYAAYTQETFHLTSNTNLTAGVRYTMDQIHANGHNDIVDQPLGIDINTGTQASSQNFGKITYRVALDHHFDEDLMAYASYNRGFKAGTYNILPFSQAPAAPFPPVKPEVVDAFELGTKEDLFEHRLRMSAAIFYNKVTNLQVQTNIPVGNPPTDAEVETNAAEAKDYGLDLNIEAVLTEHLTANFSTTIQNPYYSSFPGAPGTAPGPTGIGTMLTTYDATGKQLLYSPKVSANLGFQYDIPSAIGAWALAANYAYTSGYPFNPDQIVNNGSVGLLSAHVSYELPNQKQWKIVFWGKNLTNREYIEGSTEQNNLGGEVVVPAPPRTYGFTVSYDM